MASRGRGVLGDDWDPMRSEYESSMNNDEDGGIYGTRDPCRLYVTNIPKTLKEDGLRAAFANYGTLCEVYMSSDPTKRYGLIRFETQGEAKIAMMKLNHTEPLHLNITIAHKSKAKNQINLEGNIRKQRSSNKNPKQQNFKQYESVPQEQEYSNDNISITSSRGRSVISNGNENYDLEDVEELDPDLDLELERLQLQAMQLLYKQRLRDVNVAGKRTMTSRSVMPSNDGKIIIRAAASEKGDCETKSNGAGDTCLTPPALQRSSSRACVSCGARADGFCAGCGITPYCSEACQTRDWSRRHRSVCHNLARTHSNSTWDAADNNQMAPAQLRRPRSPARDAGGPKTPSSHNNNDKKYQKPQWNSAPGSRPPLRHETIRDKKPTSAAVTYNSKPTSAQAPKKPFNRSSAAPDAAAVKSNSPTAKPAVAAPVSNISPPVSANIVVPPAPVVEKLAPPKCLLDLLEVGATLVASVDRAAAECATDVEGFVCLTMHADHQEPYLALCEDFLAACESDTQDYSPKPGELFAIFNVADEAWYRARLLTPAKAALLDAASVIATDGARCKRLQQKFAELPEFSCALTISGVQVGESLSCTIKSRSCDGQCAVAVVDASTGEARGEGVMARWRPRVEQPPAAKPTPVANPPQTPAVHDTPVNVPVKPAQTPSVQPVQPPTVKPAQPPQVGASVQPPASATKAVPAGQPAPKQVPEVSRPPLDGDSRVLIVDVTEEHLVVRPGDATATRLANLLEQDVAHYGLTATPLTAPPSSGQTLIAQFTDGLHYRALCKRTSVKLNKYLLEYVEYGNVETSTMEKLYPCPESLGLQARPALTSFVKLQGLVGTPVTPQAAAYLDALKGQTATVTIPSGDESVPSGSEVILTLTKTRENVNQKLTELCKPEWKKVEESGADVLTTQILELSDVEYLPLPVEGCALRVLDCSSLAAGSLACYPAAAQAHAQHVLGALAERLAEYCESELGKDPYLPRIGEACIAKFPADEQWYRAVVCEMPDGAGSAAVTVAYLDFGNVCDVPAINLRKMQPEFLRGVPALASTLEIKDFPAAPSPAAIQAARAYLKVEEDGTGGDFAPASCVESAPGFFVVDAPGLLEAMAGL